MPQIKCQRCQQDADGATAAPNRTLPRSFIASSIFLAWGDQVKVLQVTALGHTPFVICRWLLELLREGGLVAPAPAKSHSCDFNGLMRARRDLAVEQGGRTLTVGSEKLLPQADQQERGKNSRDQTEKGMGEYFFVDPS